MAELIECDSHEVWVASPEFLAEWHKSKFSMMQEGYRLCKVGFKWLVLKPKKKANEEEKKDAE